MTASTFRHDLRAVLAAAEPRTRHLLWITAGLGFLAGMLEAISVGAVVPLVIVLTDPSITARLSTLATVIPRELLDNRQLLILAGAAAFALLFLLKSALSLFVTALQSRTRSQLTADLAARLFADYLQRPYIFHLHRNAADIQTRLMHGVYSAAAALGGITQLAVEGIALLAIGALLIYVNATAAFLAFLVIGLPAYGINHILRRRVRKAGADMHELYQQIAESTLNALGGIKELKVLGREAFFHSIYRTAHLKLASVETHHGALQAAPRLVLELATVCAVLALAGLLAMQGQIMAIAPILGLYAAAAFRVLPAVSRVLSGWQTIRHSEAGLRKVAEDLSVMPAHDPVIPAPASVIPAQAAVIPAKAGIQFSTRLPGPSTTPLHLTSELHLENVSFQYPGAAEPVLRDVNLTIKAGECIGITGPTGAGKSTLLDLILGILEPASGRIVVDGQDIRSRGRDWQAGIGFVPQSIFLLDDTIRANVAFGVPANEIDDARVWRTLEAAQLASFVSTLPEALDAKVGERGVRISGGERQRIGVARALYHGPGMLILDEATSALDNATETNLLSAVFALRGQMTIVIVAHRLTTVERCDRIMLLRGDCVINGDSNSPTAASDELSRLSVRTASVLPHRTR